jgi:hypothetical protein
LTVFLVRVGGGAGGRARFLRGKRLIIKVDSFDNFIAIFENSVKRMFFFQL